MRRSPIWFASLVLLLTVVPAAGQDADVHEGRWTLRASSDDPTEFHLELRRGDDRTQYGSDVERRRFLGLPEATVVSGGSATFRVEAPAGTIRFEGRFSGGRGEGRYVFEPDAGFRSALAGEGFRDVRSEHLLALAFEGVDLGFVRDLKRMDLGRLDADDLVAAAIFDVTPAFASEMRGLGLRHDDFDDLVQLRVFDIDRDYVDGMREAGYDVGDHDEIVAARVHDIDPEYVREVRALGFDPTMDQLVQLRVFDIDAAFIKEMASVGYGNLTIDELVQLRVFDIDREYVVKLKEAGVTTGSVERMVERKIFDRSQRRQRR